MLRKPTPTMSHPASTAPTREAAARAVDLYKAYGSGDTAVIALDHVNVEFGRNEFTAITSLLPGSVPAGDTADGILYHCLDVGEPVAQQMAQEESLLARVLVAGQRHV